MALLSGKRASISAGSSPLNEKSRVVEASAASTVAVTATAAAAATAGCSKRCFGVSLMPDLWARDDLEAADRIAADRKEVVVDADAIHVENFSPDVRKCRFGSVPRRNIGIALWGRACSGSGSAARSILPLPVRGSVRAR